MNNRPKAWIILGAFVLVILMSLIAQFVYPAHRNIFVALMSFVTGSLLLYVGIKQHRATKEKGVSVPWWKSYLIIGSLLQYCVAGLYITTGLANIMGKDSIGRILGAPFALLTVGLSIYVIILMWQRIETNKTSKQSPAGSPRATMVLAIVIVVVILLIGILVSFLVMPGTQ